MHGCWSLSSNLNPQKSSRLPSRHILVNVCFPFLVSLLYLIFKFSIIFFLNSSNHKRGKKNAIAVAFQNSKLIANALISVSQLTSESFAFRSGESVYNSVEMRGRHVDSYSMYKRGTRDHIINTYDYDKEQVRLLSGVGKDIGNPSWKRSFPYILLAALSSFLFGYHLGVVNETLESMSHDLGFHGDTMAEGLVVSTCLGGAFVGSLFGGLIADGVGRRRAFQLCALPLIIGSSMSATAKNLWGMLLGRLFVGTGMGIGPPVAALYVAEVSPAYVRGTYGSCSQLATCLGLMGALFIGFPAKQIEGWWRMCFWASVAPAALLTLFMEFSVESPHWLFKRGRGADAEAEFEKLLGGPYVKGAMAELSKSQRGDEADTVKLSELFYGRHRKVVFMGYSLFALQQLSGINASISHRPSLKVLVYPQSLQTYVWELPIC